MAHDGSKSNTAARWGSACASCASAKAKCIQSGATGKSRCQRCERLDKECRSQIHKPRKKRQSKPSKTAQLEQRLNSLVDLLKATNAGDVPPSARHTANIRAGYLLTNSELYSSSPSRASPDLPDNSTTPNFHIARRPHIQNNDAPRCNCRPQPGERMDPIEDDETLLSIYVNELMPHFPFVTLEPGITAIELSFYRPSLFAAIKMVASYRDLQAVRHQQYSIMRHLTSQVMMGPERSLEMLQVVLLLLGYYNYSCMMHAQMTNLAGLAVSLAADLGINRPPQPEQTGFLSSQGYTEASYSVQNEGKRALCGVWYLNSVVSLSFQRLDSVRFTPYLEQCIRDLETSKELETDLLLVDLVRVQHLAERIALFPVTDSPTGEGHSTHRETSRSGFHRELERLKKKSERNQSKLLQLHFYSAALRLWEMPPLNTDTLDKILVSPQPIPPSLPHANRDIDHFFRTNFWLKSWFTFFLSFDITDYFVLPMPACAQLLDAVTQLSKWAQLSDPELDPGENTPGPSFSSASHSGGDSIASSTVTSSWQSVHSSANSRQSPYHQIPRNSNPAAIRLLKAHLHSQPELQMDTVGILNAMMSRFEEARNLAISRSPVSAEDRNRNGSEGWHNSVWYLAAQRINMTRLLLERWADTGGPGAMDVEPQRQKHHYNDNLMGGHDDDAMGHCRNHSDSSTATVTTVSAWSSTASSMVDDGSEASERSPLENAHHAMDLLTGGLPPPAPPPQNATTTYAQHQAYHQDECGLLLPAAVPLVPLPPSLVVAEPPIPPVVAGNDGMGGPPPPIHLPQLTWQQQHNNNADDTWAAANLFDGLEQVGDLFEGEGDYGYSVLKSLGHGAI